MLHGYTTLRAVSGSIHALSIHNLHEGGKNTGARAVWLMLGAFLQWKGADCEVAGRDASANRPGHDLGHVT